MTDQRAQQGSDILILGGGAIGLATALELAGRGLTVRVLERQQAGRESSWAGAGILSTLPPWNYGEAVRRLAEYSLSLYPDWVERLRQQARTDPEYRTTGMAVLPPWEIDAVQAWIDTGGHAEPYLPDFVLRALPPESSGLWLPQVAQVRNPRLIQALREALGQLGVMIETDTEVVSIDTTNARVTGIKTARGPRQAENYVLCAGAWSSTLLGPLAGALAVRPVRGQILLYQAQPDRLPAIVYQADHYLVPRADGHILAGSTLEEVGFDKRTTQDAHVRLHAEVTRLLPDVAAHGPIRHWAGLRPGSHGNIPTIGRHPQLENLYTNTGHFRYGATFAPGSTRLLADLIQGHASQIDTTPYAWPAAASSTLL